MTLWFLFLSFFRFFFFFFFFPEKISLDLNYICSADPKYLWCLWVCAESKGPDRSVHPHCASHGLHCLLTESYYSLYYRTTIAYKPSAPTPWPFIPEFLKWTLPSLMWTLLSLMLVKAIAPNRSFSQNRMANSADHDETAHYGQSHQDLHCFKNVY